MRIHTDGAPKVIVSSHNSLGDGRYYDVESSSSFAFDHSTQARFSFGQWRRNTDRWQKASAVQSYVLESSQSDLVYVE